MRLALYGSGEFEPWHTGIDRLLLDGARPGGRVLILPTASAPEGDEVFARWASKGVAHYRDDLGIEAEVVPLRTRDDAERDEVVAMIEGASLAFFSGGNPGHLARVLTGTPFWSALLAAMGDGLAYAGCSAGAIAIGAAAPDSAARGTGIAWGPGLGLLRDTCVAAHWDVLDTYVPGLSDLILQSVPAGVRLIAIDERTALVGDGTDWQVIGAGGVHLRRPGGRWLHILQGGTLRERVV